MVDWLDEEVSLDANTAALIASGMRKVAMADGQVHQRELALIASFEAQLPKGGVEADAALETAELRSTFVRSLTMVALADGKISPAEDAKVRELASERQVPAAEIDAAILDVKRRFLQVFAGVRLFRDSVVEVARELGLPDSEADRVLEDATS